MKTKILLFVLSLMITGIISGQIIHVPADQPDIQSGINAAVDGDTVLVADDTYYENIRFNGKEIIVASHFIMDGDTNHINNTIIDGSQPINPDSAAVVMFIHGEDTTSILNGFTITGGTGLLNMTWQFWAGGGIYTSNAGAKIVNNKIINNHVEGDANTNAGGAGIQFLFGEDEHWAVVDNNTISHNTSTSHNYSAFGGGIWISINGIIRNNTIEHNSCINDSEIADGGGIEVEVMPGVFSVDVTVHNNLIRYNSVTGVTDAVGAGLMGWNAGCVVTNNTFTYNTAISTDHSSGGGLYINVADSGTLLMNNIFQYNSCEANVCWGGGARIRLADYLMVIGNNFSHNNLNSIEYSYGSGLAINRPGYSAVVTGNTMSNNTMNGGYMYGGGCLLWKIDSVPMLFNKNIIENNAADYGGGIYFQNTYNTNMSNNILRGNSATAWGGGIIFWHYVDKDSRPPTEGMDDARPDTDFQTGKSVFHPFLANNDFLDNTASNGGAIYSNHETNMPIFLNNIFWGNVAPAFNEIYCAQVVEPFTVSTCDIDTDEIRGNWNGHGNFLLDPLFIDDSCHLNCTSPCINAGDEYVEVDGVMFYAPLTALDGIERPLEEIYDVGVDEEYSCTFLPEENKKDLSMNIIIVPNPSTGHTSIMYQVAEPGIINVHVLNSRGELIQTFSSGMQIPGEQELMLDLSHLPNGLYLIRLQAGSQVETSKIILHK